jgi:glycosyltransferase involved in cell wall biosynthesis
MRIAQVAPLHECVPPKTYGGTERVVSWLTEEMVRQGHEVTLFATGDSQTSAQLVPIAPRGLRLEEGFMVDKMGFHFLALEKIKQAANDFDIIHFHSDYLHLPYAKAISTKSLATSHSRLDYKPLLDILSHHTDYPLVSISDAQRRPAPWLNWQKTIYHGMPANLLALNEKASDYLLFLGRLCPEKRPDRAIEIARLAGIKLVIAAKVDPVDRDYFETVIKPLLNDPLVEYIGEINDSQKQDFIGNALALIHPIEFPEPFGLVMIESFACGTPVVAFRTGSIPEVIDGFVVDDIACAVKALDKIGSLSRSSIRHIFDQRFTSQRMVGDYLSIYNQLIEQDEALQFAPQQSPSRIVQTISPR